MYRISDAQIDYILDDISARGVGMVSLQQDLLDHICCIIERDLEDDGDFERFYRHTVSTFYKSELKEIEAETINLLIHKNYYVMKKIMLGSGAFSVAMLTLGIFFKFMHLPGAAVCILLGIVSLSFIFLPLMFTLKAKEQQSKNDKIITAIGTFAGILISLGILFKIMHWPGANVMCSVALGIMLVVFLPVYFFSGVRNPQTKVNTIVSSVLLFAGCALILTLIRLPYGSKKLYVRDTDYFLRNEKIVQSERRLLAQMKSDSMPADGGKSITQLCDEIKSFLIESETGRQKIDADFETKGAWIADGDVNRYFEQSPEAYQKLVELKKQVTTYNTKNAGKSGFETLPTRNSIFDDPGTVRVALNDLIQIQMIVLQNQRGLLAKN